MIEADAGEFGDRYGQDGEVDAADLEAEGEIADESAGESGDRHRHQKPNPRADAEMHIERRRRVGAEADIERVAERQLPGETHHDVPRLAYIGEVQNENEHGEQIVAGHQRRGEQPDEQRAEKDQRAARDIFKKPRKHHAAFLPMMP